MSHDVPADACFLRDKSALFKGHDTRNILCNVELEGN
jgi:hypothetical protein